ncbi:MAG: hypothetical protein Q7S22_08560 [Candidatus Micrarchaeota archaeon]|nr:hypothetical protein [Candidatus Micrarchaeota archaeon]
MGRLNPVNIIDGHKVLADILAFGISDVDAKVILDSIIYKTSTSWVNNDSVDNTRLAALNQYITNNNFGIMVLISPVSSRSKFIWDIKVRK